MSSFPVLEMVVRCYIGYRVVLYLFGFRRRDKLKRSIRGLAFGGGHQFKITKLELDTAITNLRRTGSHRALSRCNSSESLGREQAKRTKEIETAKKNLGRLKLLKIGLRVLAIALVAAFFFSFNESWPSSPFLVDDPAVEVCGTAVASSTQQHCVSKRENTFHERLRLSVATAKFMAATSIRTVLGPLARQRNNDQRGIANDSLELYLERIEREAHETWEAIALKSGLLQPIIETEHDSTIGGGDGSNYNASIKGERSHVPSTVGFGLRKRPRKGRRIIRRTIGKLFGKIKCKIRGCSVRASEEVHHVSQDFMSPPELDLNMTVPCHYLTAEMLHSLRKSNTTGRVGCILRDVMTRELLVQYAKQSIGEFDMATHPILLRNIWPPQSFATESNRRLTIEGLLKDPELSTVDLPNHFPDASQAGYPALVPDNSRQVTLFQFVSDLLSGRAAHAKIGTQLIVEAVPELTEEIVPRGLARELFGWNPWVDDLKSWLKDHVSERIQGWINKFPSASCYPVFVARQHPPSSNHYPRTDLHAEPIGNIAVQLEGSRRWTLVSAEWSTLLRPTVSKHGRGYIYANLDPKDELSERLRQLPQVFECITNRGDAIWIPPWHWHKIDYNVGTPNESNETQLSVGASVFHFYPMMYAFNMPLFAYLIVPNLIWEALGFNTE
mmetsp:Transcript_21755/g.51255  ORF Transcript_21755/g.51255 Transcript_21755/m.51255 type:complete len:670 (-) Transcript_21755:342-2351(-)